MKINKICISFKNNEKELKLYDFLASKISPSTFVKELLEKEMEGNNESNKEVQTTSRGFDF